MSDINDVACVQQAIDDVIKEVNEGNVKGLTFQVLYDDGCHMTGATTNLTYLEKLGMLESAKNDVVYKTLHHGKEGDA